MMATDNNFDNTKSSSQICKVDSKGDPVDILSIWQEEYAPSQNPPKKGNMFIGYYGINRTGSNTVKYKIKETNKEGKKKIKCIRQHTGYDYLAKEGTPVKAVGNGKIVRVRFGRRNGDFSCPFKTSLFSHIELQLQLLKQFLQNELLQDIQQIETSKLELNNNALLDRMNQTLIKTMVDAGTIGDIIIRKRIKELQELQNSLSKEESDAIKQQERIIKTKIEEKEKEIIDNSVDAEHKKKKIHSRFSGIITCKSCDKREGCYGVQVWLQLDKNKKKYAYYAHLSDLSEKILSKLLEHFKSQNNYITKPKTNTIDFEIPISVNTGDIIGYSGCTGNAWNAKQEHLHFECRESKNQIPEVTNTQIPSKDIVKTEIYLTKNQDTEEKEKIWKITKEHLGITEKAIDEQKFDWEKRKDEEWNRYKRIVWDKEKGSEKIKRANWRKHIIEFKKKQWLVFKTNWPKITKDECDFLEYLLMTEQYDTYKKAECMLIEYELFQEKYDIFKTQHSIKYHEPTCTGDIIPQ